MRNTFEVMAGLEALSGELAAQRITDEELAEIRAMQFEMMAAYTRRDLSNYYRLNARIHSAINAAAKNPVLTATYNQVNARLQALRFRSNQDGEKWKRAVKEHEQMIEALAARDAAAMREVLLSHLHNKRDVVLEQLRRDAQTPPRREPRNERPAAAEGGARACPARPTTAVARRQQRGGRPAGAAPGRARPRAKCCSPRPTAAATPPTRRSTR